MNKQRLDLHTHTIYSDGELTPYELFTKAKEIGLTHIAVTDHDTIAGIAEERRAAEEVGIAFIPGIEISTQEKEEVHILGLGIEETNALLVEKCREFSENRGKRAQLICGFLNRRNIPVKLEEVQAIAKGEVIARPHFAAYLVQSGYVSNQKEAFARYLNTPQFHAEVTRIKPSPQEVIALIHQAGGKAVLAHPGLLKKNRCETEAFIRELTEAGLDGIECIYQKHTPSEEMWFLELAKTYGLATGCGSDFHGIHVKPDVPLGMEIDEKRRAGVPLVVATE